MPLGQRIAHVAPERPRCIRDLLGELLVSAGNVLPKVKASEIRVVALPGGISDPTEDAGELAQTVSPPLERLDRRLERLSPQCQRSSDSAGPAAGCERSPRCGPA
jgi:hypothetical protein